MPEGAQRVEGTNKANENGETMNLIGIRLTAQLERIMNLEKSLCRLTSYKNLRKL